MTLIEILLVATSLALDAAVVSVGAGALNRISVVKALGVAAVFGIFQAAMPLLGWLGGYAFGDILSEYGHIIGFVVILLVGLKMLKEAFERENAKNERNILDIGTLLALAVATSIDALAVGITFNFIPVSIPLAVAAIGIVTFLLCLIGIYVGQKGKHLIGMKIEALGGIVLIALAFKVLLF